MSFSHAHSADIGTAKSVCYSFIEISNFSDYNFITFMPKCLQNECLSVQTLVSTINWLTY